jgi:hypothetical protein
MATMESFVVKLGFNIDETSVKRFKDTMEQGVKSVEQFRQVTANLPKVKLGNSIDETSAKGFKDTLEKGAKQVSHFRSVLGGLATGVAAHTRQKLGFNVDEASTKRFKDTIDHGIRQVNEFKLALAGLAVGVEEAVRRTMRSFDQLYFTAASTGVPEKKLADLTFALNAVGVGGQRANALMEGLAETLRTSGESEYLKGISKSAGDAADQFLALKQRWLEAYREGGGSEAAGSRVAQLKYSLDSIKNLDYEALRAAALHDEIFEHARATRARVADRFKLNDKEAAAAAQKATEAWDEFVLTVSTGIGKVVSDNFQSIQAMFQALSEWLSDERIIKAFGEIADGLKEFFKNEDNRKAFIKDLEYLKVIIIAIAKAVHFLIRAFGGLADAIGPVNALIATLAGVYLAKMLLMRGATWALAAAWRGVKNAMNIGTPGGGGPAAPGAAPGAKGGVGGIGAARGLLTGFSFFSMLQTLANATPEDLDQNSEKNRKKREGITQGLNESTGGWFSTIFGAPGRLGARIRGEEPPKYQRGGIVSAGLHPGEMVLPANISFGLQQLFSRPAGGGGFSGDELLEEFKAWWAGDASFKPFVDLAASVYEKLQEVLIFVADQTLKAMGYKEGIYGGGEGAAAEGAGAGAGEPHTGVAGAGRMPGRVEPDGTPAAPPGEPGQYRPKYNLSSADVSERVLRTIAGEATSSQESTDAVINTMFNRLGTGGYGKSGNLEQVASAPNQFVGYARNASAERLAFIKSRIEAIASGAVPDITQGANEFRTGSYMGPWGQAHRDAPVIGGNRFARNPRGGTSPYAAYPTPAGAPGTSAAAVTGTGGGAAIPHAKGVNVEGFQPEFKANLGRLLEATKVATGATVQVTSGFRSYEHQMRLWLASDRSGKMVARPGHSRHEGGMAADLSRANKAALQYIHQHAKEYGLGFPMSYEDWHIEPLGARGRGGGGAREVSNTTNIHVHGSHNSEATAQHVANLQDRTAVRNTRPILT